MSRPTTIQRLDPASGLDSVMTARIVAVIVPMYVGGVMITHHGRYSSPLAALSGFVVVVAACAVMAYFSDPRRAPYTRTRFLIVIGLGLVAACLEAFAGFGISPLGYTHWGPLAVGLLFVAHAAYQSPRTIVITTVVAAIVIAVCGSGITSVSIGASLAPAVLLFSAPPVILGVASAAFATSIIDSLQRWKRTGPLPEAAEVATLQGIARAVQQDHVTVLNRDVVPLLTAVVERGEVTEADIAAASTIADTMRASLVAGAHRTWLDAAAELRGAVDDPEQLARWMTDEQRGAVRALLEFLGQLPEPTNESIRIRLRPFAGRFVVEVSWRMPRPSHSARLDVQPYFALLRTLFDGLEVDHRGGTMRILFSYVR